MANKITGSIVKKFARTNTLLQSIVRTINSLIDEQVTDDSAVAANTAAIALIAPQVFMMANSGDIAVESTDVYFRAPFDFTLKAGALGVKAALLTAPTDADAIFDIFVNGVSILSTKCTIEATEKTSATATTPPVISTAEISEGDEVRLVVTQVGSTIAGADPVITLIGDRI
jgi:hypothetical protein